ncbi:MAG TPA: response regulator [Azospirillaceae bacterium]|nr:response regulator [Azospirillaceae bacterium]
MAHVLVVDDEVMCALSVKSQLDVLGHRVSVAFTVADAVRCYDHDPADAVITDYRMPRMNGLDLIHHLRDRSRHLPIMVLTAYSPDAEALFRGHGAPIAVVDKPAEPETIEAALDELLASARPAAPQTSIRA